jgi:hypothetical protein
MSTPETSNSSFGRARNRGDAASWQKLTDNYAPLIRRWVAPKVAQDANADDLAFPADPFSTLTDSDREGRRVFGSRIATSRVLWG